MNTQYRRPIQTRWFALLSALVLVFLTILPVTAQGELVLSVNKEFGYNSGSQIRGTFSLKVRGPEDLQSVTFFIDGQKIADDPTPPFEVLLETGDYAYGIHELSATGQTAGGVTLVSQVRRFEFITNEQQSAGIQRILLPLGGLVVGIMLFGLVSQLWMGRSGKNRVPLGASRNYGVTGGTICPKCKRPFPMHIWGLNIGFATKLDRCDHCGKWSIVRRQSPETLARAEAAELEMGKPELPITQASEEEKLRQMLDESRYIKDK